MNIGIVSPFNPICLSEYLEGKDIPDTHTMASSVHCIAIELMKQGHCVYVFTSDANIESDVVVKGSNCVVCVVSRKSRLKKVGIPPILTVVKKLETAISQFIQEIDVLHAHWTYEYALASCFFVNKTPVFCTVRDWCPYHFKKAKGTQDKLLWGMKYLMFKRVMNCKSLHVIANSQYTAKEVRAAYPRINPAIIPNPIDKELIVAPSKGAQFSRRFISIAQTLTNPAKNIENLLIAYQKYHAKYPESCLCLVGNAESGCVQIWREKGLLEGTYFTGNLSHDDVIKEIDYSSCLVHPSRQETFGNILIEAMARGIPCIGGEMAAAVPYVLDNGNCGLLCDIESPIAIFDAMERIGDTEMREKIVSNSSSLVSMAYASDMVVKHHIELYEQFLMN